LEPYDSDKQYTVYRFGARVKNSHGGFDATAEHCFPIYSGQTTVAGVDGILQVSIFFYCMIKQSP